MINFFKAFWKTDAKNWLYASLLPDQVPDNLGQNDIIPQTAYVDIYLRSLRITHVRKGLSKFYGAVHSHINVSQITGEKAKFQVVTTPAELSNADASNLDRVININKRLLGPVPYQGGDIELELGLFSIKSADLAAPYLKLLENMSNVAGVSLVKNALPFMQPISEGINLLAGAQKEKIMEIGLSETINKPATGYRVLMRVERDEIDTASLMLNSDFTLSLDGEDIKEYPYMVFCIEAKEKRDAWYQIPELAEAHNKIREAIRAGDYQETENQLIIFKKTALTSPDLISKDARRLVQEIEADVKAIMAATKTSAKKRDLRPLDQVDIYSTKKSLDTV